VRIDLIVRGPDARNLDRRVEIAFPLLDPGLQAQIARILDIQLADTAKARRILSDGSSVRIGADGEASLRSQERLYEAAADSGASLSASATRPDPTPVVRSGRPRRVPSQSWNDEAPRASRAGSPGPSQRFGAADFRPRDTAAGGFFPHTAFRGRSARSFRRPC